MRFDRGPAWGRLTRWAALGMIALWLVSACGVPNSGAPVTDRTIAPDRGVSVGLSQSSTLPDATTPVGLVEKYLETTAGATNADDQLAAARAFMTPTAAKDFKTSPVYIVRPIDDLKDTQINASTDTVTGTFQVVGLFSIGSGQLEPPQQPQVTLTFTTTPNPESSKPGPLRLSEVPPYMVMSEAMFQISFAPHPIYFWDNSRNALIPDLRYTA
ncbi:MAG TPA: hypothetical protein VH442_19410, partial [Micromonosporaceae bacterium]